MRALLPFLRSKSVEIAAPAHDVACGRHRILIADDEVPLASFCRLALESEGLICEQVSDGKAALDAIAGLEFDLILLDVDMPGMSGIEVCRRLRENSRDSHVKVVMMSGRATADEMALMVASGADDYLTKPFSVVQLQTRVKAALHLRDAQRRNESLNFHLLAVNTELGRRGEERGRAPSPSHTAFLAALARLGEHRSGESGGHLFRLQRYCRCLAEEAMREVAFEGQIEPAFIDTLELCAPLHDIGMLALPDNLVLKPGKLEPEERLAMQTHTIIGAEVLHAVAQDREAAPAFLRLAVEVARHHHERYDGQGYPDRLAGADIPLAARIVAIADVYDALRSRRPYRPALDHSAAVRIITEMSAGQFDPHLVRVFGQVANRFERIFSECAR